MIQPPYETCIHACQVCAQACDHCASACLGEADPRHLARCISLDMDCSQLCHLASALMARGSDYAGACCSLCAEICEACAAECAKHDHDHCQRCAQACLHCAEACRSMSVLTPVSQASNPA